MSNFSFTTDTKEFLNTPYPVGIFNNNIITAVEVVNPESGSPYIDIHFENLDYGYTMRDRTFNVGDSVPSWTTPEKELNKIKGHLKHIMGRFIPAEEQVFDATGFVDMCNKIAALLNKYAIATKKPVSLITVYDRNFQWTELRKGKFLAAEGEEPLKYSEKEERRNFPEKFEVEEPQGETEQPGEATEDAPKF